MQNSGYSEQSYGTPSFGVDLSGIWEREGLMADNEINSQLTKIDKLLREIEVTK
ncbi:MAG: hypothetical protein PHR39_01370 [Actinomycetota bacterium]|nr:hypothetical protein [Actinomycetota bacterium]